MKVRQNSQFKIISMRGHSKHRRKSDFNTKLTDILPFVCKIEESRQSGIRSCNRIEEGILMNEMQGETLLPRITSSTTTYNGNQCETANSEDERCCGGILLQGNLMFLTPKKGTHIAEGCVTQSSYNATHRKEHIRGISLFCPPSDAEITLLSLLGITGQDTLILPNLC
jgi:hypothetical protein